MGVFVIKKIILFLLGFTPLLLGYVMNSWMMENLDKVLPLKLIGFLFLAFWLLIGLVSNKLETSLVQSFVIAHLPALLMLLLIMYQEWIVDAFWSNLFGLAPQFYFIPLMNLSASVIGILGISTKGIWFACLLALLYMVAAYYIGNYIRRFLD
ncbi:hypothetical protein [Ornithinibacillus halotolerans]|uniref:Uncharacterized protein n=1 Tax=Ornithinibacillus halotolerans TaxID=1274357 RepID=A0A916RN02_9BACI|nr:hypothetical protein [Ornithinibacillus halotolerans]GGA60095.1 hypothetical protein GCM10008025_00160 [Ornithinibacillus halotolerans]